LRIPPTSVAFTVLLGFLVALPSFGIDMSLPALTAMRAGRLSGSMTTGPNKGSLPPTLVMWARNNGNASKLGSATDFYRFFFRAADFLAARDRAVTC
jgi:hypothetical protein